MFITKLTNLARKGSAVWHPFGRKHCVVCGHTVGNFLPYRGGSRNLPPLMRVLDVVGSDIDNFFCPRCGAHDRERHILMYLQAGGLMKGLADKAVLHFAPERRLAQLISAKRPARYLRCDLQPTSDDIRKMDMLAMDLEPYSFDLVIANHVLEHVADDYKALSEVRRVLKVGGYAILQTPFSAKLHGTWEDAGIADEVSRLQAYAQEDHVRLYGRDIFERFASSGLQSRVQTHAQLLPDVDAGVQGVNSQEPFFLFQRVQ